MQGDASAADPPSRAARLSDVSGQVWLYNPDTNDWAGVSRNQPLTSGDRIATDNDGRAEITLGTTVLRLDAATEIEIVRLDDSRYVVRLQSGSVAARLRNAQSLGEFELVTDEGRFRVQAVGRYRFDRAEQTSDVTVANGRAIYENGNTALPVTTGQHAQFWLDAGGVPQYAMAAPVRDDFFAWNDERDRAAERVVATRYVSPEMTGAEDLDRYGEWQQTPDYGPIWVPASVPIGWAPYSAGHWAWVRPWGWTWVDDQRWGFAPFHYGRWVYHRNAWCWAPGTYVARPVYAPALVAWVGGPRVGVSITVGGGAPVGWFPLAPHEVYVPSYRASTRYVREVNVTHVTNVTTITTIVNNRHGEADRRDFANRHFEHAVTFVPAEVMTRRQPVAPAAAQFRNDPQVREFVREGRPAPVLNAPPVAAPPVVARAPDARPAPRPPFAGRPPASVAGRPEGARPEPGRAEPGRPDVASGRDGRGAPPSARTPPPAAVTAAPPPAAVTAPPPGVATAAVPGAVATPPPPARRAASHRERTWRRRCRLPSLPRRSRRRRCRRHARFRRHRSSAAYRRAKRRRAPDSYRAIGARRPRSPARRKGRRFRSCGFPIPALKRPLLTSAPNAAVRRAAAMAPAAPRSLGRLRPPFARPSRWPSRRRRRRRGRSKARPPSRRSDRRASRRCSVRKRRGATSSGARLGRARTSCSASFGAARW